MELFVPFVSAAVALALVAVGFLVGCIAVRLGRGRASHVVSLPADRPIPVDSESYQRAAEKTGKATRRPGRFYWVLIGAVAGIPLQLIVALLLGVVSYSYCRPQTRAAEATQTPELPPRPERSPDASQTEGETYGR